MLNCDNFTVFTLKGFLEGSSQKFQFKLFSYTPLFTSVQSPRLFIEKTLILMYTQWELKTEIVTWSQAVSNDD